MTLTRVPAAALLVLLLLDAGRAAVSGAPPPMFEGYDTDTVAAVIEAGAFDYEVDTNSLPTVGGNSQYSGGGVAENTGKVYLCPSSVAAVAVLDPETLAFDPDAIPAQQGGAAKWRAGFAYANSTGLLYAAPFNHEYILVVNPLTNTSDFNSFGPFFGSGKWSQAIFVPPSAIYFVPHVSASVLRLDLAANATDTGAMAGLAGDCKWYGGVLVTIPGAGGNPGINKIFAAPGHSSSVLVIDTQTDQADTSSITRIGAGIYKWLGAEFVAAVRLVFFAPWVHDAILTVDPVTYAVGYIRGLGTGDSWGDGKYAGIRFVPATRRLCLTPWLAESMLVVDPTEFQGGANYIIGENDVTVDDTSITGFGRAHLKYYGDAMLTAGGDRLVLAPFNDLGVAVVSISVDPRYTRTPTTSPTSPTRAPTQLPSTLPTWLPTTSPTVSPTTSPTVSPTTSPTTSAPTDSPTKAFALSACGAPQQRTIQLEAQNARYAVGDSVTIPAFGELECSNRSAVFTGKFVEHGSAHDIIFGVSIADAVPDQDYETCISPRTGRATITILASMSPGAHAARLFARDGFNEVVDIATWSMDVQTGDGFAYNANSSCAATQLARLRATTNDESTGVRGVHERGAMVIVPGFNTTACPLSELFTSYRRTGRDSTPDVTFKLHVTRQGDREAIGSLGADTFVNSDSGKLLLKLDSLGRYDVTVQAKSGDNSVDLLTWPMRVRQGPNGSSCGEYGSPDPADDAFDSYTCVCTADYDGANCDEPPVPPDAGSAGANSDDETSVTIGASLGTVVVLMLVALGAFRLQLHRLKHSPRDMGEMQENVLEGYGIPLPKDIGGHEFGITVTLGADLDEADISQPEQLKPRVLATFAKSLPRLADELRRARVMASKTSSNQILLIIPRPCGYGKQSDVAERTVAALSKLAAKRGGRRLAVGPNTVSAVTLAIPRRVPRELNRAQLTRIAVLGEGAFGEVCLYQIDESKRGIPLYKAAVKTVKPLPGSVTVDSEELLREAALMSAMDHRYVLALVGVVTVPRDLPALIVLQYCEGGELLEYVAQAGPTGLTTTRRLTCAAQIALGMQYMTTRNIVHRDLAARNVLLDAMGSCKVADFGMSASLVQTGRIYAAKYVRVHQEIALRWASPEALQHEKFSPASDVWAYGVTVWEIFGSGLSEPYGDFGNAEIGPYIKGGGQLAVPPGDVCPPQIFDEVMQPCWAMDAAERPSFGELYDKCVVHGAVEDQVTLEERAAARGAPPASTTVLGDARCLAPSVHYLSATLLPELHSAVRPVAEANLAGQGDPNLRFPLLDVCDASSYQVKDYVVVPSTRDVLCKRDNQLGAIFVDTLSGANNVGAATAILSYAWKYSLRLVSGALDDWCGADGLDPKRQYVWLDVLCWNQHGRLSDPVAEWTPRVAAIGRQLTMLHPWNRPIYTTRAWCIFELWYAIGLGARCDLGIILAPEDRVAFHDAIMREGYGVVDSALDHIHAESAEAFSTDDLASITAKIKSTPGGFDTLNEVVKQRLRQWFESQGGIKARDGSRGSAGLGALQSRSKGKTGTLRAMPTVQLLEEEQYHSYQDVKLGDRVTVLGYQSAGVVRFVGAVETKRTHGKDRVGIELDTPEGKNSGIVDGQQYFKCPDRHGLLVPRTRVTLLAHGNVSGSNRTAEEFGFGAANSIATVGGDGQHGAGTTKSITDNVEEEVGFETTNELGDGYLNVQRESGETAGADLGFGFGAIKTHGKSMAEEFDV